MNFTLTGILLAVAIIASTVEGKAIGRRDAPYPPAVHSTYGVPAELKTIPFVPEIKPALEILDISNELLPEKRPELFVVPKVPEIKLEVPIIPAAEYGLPKIVVEEYKEPKIEIPVIPAKDYGVPDVFVPEGLPELPPTPVIPEIEIEVPAKEYGVPEIEIPIIPAKEYGVPEEIKVIVPEIPKVFVPEGLPELPPAPVIPEIKIEVPAKEYGVPEIETPIIPAKEYGVPEEIKVIVPEIPKVFVPEGLPELPPAPIIPEIKIEVPAKEYGVPEIEIPAYPAKEYGVPEEIKVIVPEIPKIFVPEGLPELPPAPVIPEIKIEVPAKEYGVPEIEIPAKEYGVPEEIKIPEIKIEIPEKKIEPEVTVIHQESKPYIPKPIPIEKIVIEESFPYPAALPASTYGEPGRIVERFH